MQDEELQTVSPAIYAVDSTPKAAWDAAVRLWGDNIRVWEPETFRIAMRRMRLSEADEDRAMARLLPVQTLLMSDAWKWDYQVLFGLAMAIEGQELGPCPHPTPELLAAAVRELEAILNVTITDDDGFDPHGVDPAVAVVLFDDGWVVTPEPLHFVQDELSEMTPHCERLRKLVLSATPETEARLQASGSEDWPAYAVQRQRLDDAKAYVNNVAARRARYVKT